LEACRLSAPASDERKTTVIIDSIVLERTRCLGECPAYRLTIDARGAVRYVSRDPKYASRSGTAHGDRALVERVMREMLRIDFFGLPAISMGDQYCSPVASDAPTVTVGLFGAPDRRVISYYRGCAASSSGRPFIVRLNSLADSIDVIANTKRWIPVVRR
jgi:hypothetical protein